MTIQSPETRPQGRRALPPGEPHADSRARRPAAETLTLQDRTIDMNRQILTALAAVLALGITTAQAAQAADLTRSGVQTPVVVDRAATNTAQGQAVRAGDLYSTQELRVSGLEESDLIEIAPRPTAQVRAGDVYSAQELRLAGLSGDEWLTVSNFRGTLPGDTAPHAPDPNR